MARVRACKRTLTILMSPCLESENLVLTTQGTQRLLSATGISDMHGHIDWSLESIRIVPNSGSDPPAPIKIKSRPNKCTVTLFRKHSAPTCSRSPQALPSEPTCSRSQVNTIPGFSTHMTFLPYKAPWGTPGQDQNWEAIRVLPHHAWAWFNWWETGSGRAY